MRFILGDENGQLKSVRCAAAQDATWKIDVSLLDDGGKQGKVKSIQQLAVRAGKVVAARGDGTAAMFDIDEHADSGRVIHQWQETRLKSGEKFVGRVISCTEAGHLRLTRVDVDTEDVTEPPSQTTTVPNRLCEWALSDDHKSFVYGGEEVEVSVWDMCRAFDASRRVCQDSALGTKRKKGQKFELLDGEIWRAKNVSNDFLNLRQPVYNTSLVYLSSKPGGEGLSHHILAGNRLGSVRRYDTRVARRPVADWTKISKVGGIKKVQRGNLEHEAFIADHGSNLMALDLRTGRVLYTYKGLAAAISSMSPTTSSLSPPLLASTSLDRFFRLHSTHYPGHDAKGATSMKCDVLAKVWLKSRANCVVWDERTTKPIEDDALDHQEDDNDIWDGMQKVQEKDDAFTDSGASDDEHSEREHKKQKAP